MAISAPAANTWDVEVITLGALEMLRLENEDVDAERVADLAVEATQLIDVELDMAPVEEPTLPFDASAVATLVRAAVKLTVELYLNPPSLDPGVSPDPVAAVRAEVHPWKARWGIA